MNMEESKPSNNELDSSEWHSETDEDPWADSDNDSDSDYKEIDNDKKLNNQRLKNIQKLGLEKKIEHDTESQTSFGEDSDNYDSLSDCEDSSDFENLSDRDSLSDCDSNSDLESDDLGDLEEVTEKCNKSLIPKQIRFKTVEVPTPAEKRALSHEEKLIAARLQQAEKICATKAADLVYFRGASKVKWNDIHIDGFTTDELKKMLKDIMQAVGPTRVLEEVLSVYLTNQPRFERNAHPDFPKKPANPFGRYLKSHSQRVRDILSDSLGRKPRIAEIADFCLKAFASLPDTDREKLKHVGEYNRESEIYKERLRIFYEEHEALRVQRIPKPDFYYKVTPKLWFREQMCYELLRFIPLEESYEMWEKLPRDEKKKYITEAYQLETTKPKLISDEEWKIMVDFPERPLLKLNRFFSSNCRHLYTGDERMFQDLAKEAFDCLHEEELHLLRKEHFEKMETWLRDLELWIRRQPEEKQEELAILYDLKCENINKTIPQILKRYKKIFIEKKIVKPRVYVQRTLPKGYDPFAKRVIEESEDDDEEEEEEEEVKPKNKLKIERFTKHLKIKIGRPGKAGNATKLKKEPRSAKEKREIKAEKLKHLAEAKAKALKIKEKEKLKKEKEKARQEMEVLEKPLVPVFLLNTEEYLPDYGWDTVRGESHTRTSPIRTRPFKLRPEILQLIPKRLKVDEPPIPALTTPFYFVNSRVCVNPKPKWVKKAYNRLNILDKLSIRDKMIRQRNEFQKAAKSYMEQVDEEKAVAFVAKVKEERAKQKDLTYWHDENGTDYENDSENEDDWKWINEPEPNAPQLSMFCGQTENYSYPAATENLMPESNTPQPLAMNHAEMINEPEPNAPQLSDFCGQPGTNSIKMENTAKVFNRPPSTSASDINSSEEDSNSSHSSTD